ncbi:MAG TPA: sodium:solute symporter [Cryomorphaceae bacterium]|nr:sodium:solute symporter [Owenweeksia sp.]MBF97526.1 sodium:solute symporter [Owenweeksia sp.]HAD97720.1 sodium:solute symporter [Cryomorphaceae bacterium]HBF20002.1 sodium:solute symporter [Cryomorphaceae bacterium]HCQ17167.1 sodium:solute symporter [Cryomorphaceae bacterium]|tara:strand:+ start:4329 stop:5792 length:1464 start_codon:yes stop_codon:yes gene_type:complete
MTPTLIITVIGLYFLLLILVSYFTGRKDDNDAFFLGNRQSPWFVVAFGMVGASLSGVTFISVPGWVDGSSFSYMQVVLGYLLGYFVIIKVLLPLYYRLELTSIYTYLDQRFGFYSYKTGAFFFILSRVIGASFRLYLVAIVLQYAVFEQYNVPFWVTVLVTIVLIWVYTFRSGIKTIIWTDTLQTAFMLAAVILTVILIKDQLIPEQGLISYIADSPKSKIFFWEGWGTPNFFWTQFLSGAFITIVMTGLDQDMMQKNLSCRSLSDAQKNMTWLSITLVVVNLIFLCLGVLLYDYADAAGITETGDKLYPAVALSGGLGLVVAVFFIIGLIAAAYSSADSALTALTTSFCVDFLDVKKMEAGKGKRVRKQVHIAFSLVLLLVILVFKYTVDESVIKELFVAAGYTYGPLLGLYAFGLFSKLNVRDKYVPIVAVIAPILSFILKSNSKAWFNYEFGFELLIVNGLLTYGGLLLLTTKKEPPVTEPRVA